MTESVTLASVKQTRHKINFLATDAERKARRGTVLVAGVFTLLVGLLAMLGADASYRAATRGVNVWSDVGALFSLTDLRKLVWNNEGSAEDIFRTPDGRLNVLILGIGGEGHDGPELTDTILFASYDRARTHLGLVSIPRDLAYPLGGGQFEKINSVNAYAESTSPGQGAKETAVQFAKLFETRIDRVIKIDFKGFTQLVNALEGIDVDVEKTFTDYQFPTEAHGPSPHLWTSVTFKKGVEHMDGTRALNYARSRHAAGGEGSDFARSRRQQLIVKAVRERLLSLRTLASPKRISDLWSAISSHVQTNFTTWELVKLFPDVQSFAHIAITSQVLTDDPDGELAAGTGESGFMLFPKKSDWSDLRAVIANPFEVKKQLVAEQRAKGVTLEVKNGTMRTGYASHIADTLIRTGYDELATG
ncbi:MAG: LCP family protein, partial [Patescibacteria group bacterium]